jgi:hypothetical protein
MNPLRPSAPSLMLICGSPQAADLDPIYLCELIKSCPPGMRWQIRGSAYALNFALQDPTMLPSSLRVRARMRNGKGRESERIVRVCCACFARRWLNFRVLFNNIRKSGSSTAGIVVTPAAGGPSGTKFTFELDFDVINATGTGAFRIVLLLLLIIMK